MEPTSQSAPTRGHPTPGALRRVVATALDLPIVVGWATLSGATGALLRLLAPEFGGPTAWDVFAFVTLVLPVTITFAWLEASPSQATFGKRRFQLIVVDAHGDRLTWRRSMARSAVKFAPWQLAHTAVFHLAAGSTAVGYVVLAFGAQLVVLASALTMVLHTEHGALHDLMAKTRVVAAVRPPGPTKRPTSQIDGHSPKQ